MDPPDDDASVTEAAGAYGIGYLAIRRIAERYGEAKMLKFFGAVLHKGDTVVEAAKSTLGTSWTNVNSDCVNYIRRQAG